MKKKILSMLLCLCMAMTAYAGTGSAMQMGTGGIASGDTVYFGTYSSTDVPWMVLGSGTLSQTSVAAGTSVLPMLSTYTLGRSPFMNGSGYYPDSDLQEAMTNLYNSIFTTKEKDVIADTTLAKYSMFGGVDELTGQKLFPLSHDEANNIGYGTDKMKAKSITDPEGSTVVWWLRLSNDYARAFLVDEDGNYNALLVENTFCERPAFFLNLSSVLFSSAAEGGKSTSVDGTMSAISSTTPSVWKLTLDDSTARNGFDVTETEITAKQGDIKTITYSGAQTAPNEYVSAMITNTAGTEILYYGKLELATSGSNQEADITIPSSLSAGNYKLKIFNEQCNGDKKTDLSSAFVDIALTVNGTPSPTPTPTPSGDDNRDSSSLKSEDFLKWYYVKDNPNSLCLITKQGALCQAVFKNATPAGYTEAFSFNLMLKGADKLFKSSYDAKTGEFVLYIPSGYQKEGRTFVLIGVDKDGKPVTFTDSDTSDTSITVADLQVFIGYAFSLIYTDKAGTAVTTESGVYTVVKGDTLSGIAVKLGKTRKYLLSKNELENPNYLYIGQKINY